MLNVDQNVTLNLKTFKILAYGKLQQNFGYAGIGYTRVRQTVTDCANIDA